MFLKLDFRTFYTKEWFANSIPGDMASSQPVFSSVLSTISCFNLIGRFRSDPIRFPQIDAEPIAAKLRRPTFLMISTYDSGTISIACSFPGF